MKTFVTHHRRGFSPALVLSSLLLASVPAAEPASSRLADTTGPSKTQTSSPLMTQPSTSSSDKAPSVPNTDAGLDTTTAVDSSLITHRSSLPPAPVPQSGSAFDLSRNVIAGGGGSNTAGGNFKLDGTLGQTAAGQRMSSGQFSVTGGFWQPTTVTPTAAPATVSGQVVDTDGRPVGGTTITVTGATQTLRAITDSHGYYRVANLETGAFYTVTPTRANYVFGPPYRSFSLLADKPDAVFTAMAVAQNANPLDSPEFFVRQHYLDFLGREPDQGGLDYWSGALRSCVNDPGCINASRIAVSAAFFVEQEFQRSGSFIYRVYKASLGRRPSYAEFSADRGKVLGGETLDDNQRVFADEWITRGLFLQLYPDSMDPATFVNKLFDTAGLWPYMEERQRQIDAMVSGGKTRAQVLREVTDTPEFKTREYNPSFVLMQYFGYLRREPDDGGYRFWLEALNNSGGREPDNYRGMVCSFITAFEYQDRFGTIHSHSNSECGR